MFAGRRVAVVIPAYNEGRFLSNVLTGVPPWVDDVWVVDDASRDSTAEIARGWGPPVRLIEHAANLGVGAAIAAGYRAATDAGADVVAVMAGDGQMLPEELWRLVGPVASGEFDYVKGERLSHPDSARLMPRVRRVGIVALTWLTRLASGYSKLGDAQCGFTAIAGDLIKTLPLDLLYPRYGYPNDLIVMLGAVGARLGERTVTPVYASEASGIRPVTAVFTHSYVLARSILLRAWYRRLGQLARPDPACATAPSDETLPARRDNPLRRTLVVGR